MPPIVALTGCLIFVAFLFRMELDHTRHLSKGLWLPTIWIILSGTRPLIYWIGGIGGEVDVVQASISGNPIDRVVLSILIAAGFVVLVKRPGLRHVLKANRAFVVLILFMGLSVLWANYPFVSLKRWIRVLGHFTMALIVATEEHPDEAIRALLRRLTYFILPLSLTVIKYYPAFGISFHRYQGFPMWIGITNGKNDLGATCCYGGFYLFCSLFKVRPYSDIFKSFRTLLHLCLLIMSLHLLRGSGSSYSATAILILITGAILFVAIGKFREQPHKLVNQFFVALAIALSVLTIINPQTVLEGTTRTVGRDTDFTGRTEIWERLLQVASERPLLGVGYGSFWVGALPLDLDEMFYFRLNQAHNGFIDIYLELGLIGLLLHTLVFGAAFRGISGSASVNFEATQFRMTLLIMIILHNITESGIFSGLSILWFLYMLAILNQRQDLIRARMVDNQNKGKTDLLLSHTCNITVSLFVIAAKYKNIRCVVSNS